MRRSAFAVLGIASILVFAACTDRPNDRAPLLPTGPSLAKGGSQCAGGLASDIAKDHDDLFTAEQMAVLDPLWDDIKAECVAGNTAPSATLLTYLEQVAQYRGDDARAQLLVNHWGQVTLYATGSAISRSYRVLTSGVIVPAGEGVRGGGADVLDGAASSPLYDLQMTTFDGQAGVKISDGQAPLGPHLVTMDPDSTACPATALNAASNDCYNVQFYPPVTTAFVPKIDVGMCLHGAGATTAVLHAEAGFGTEVLPDGDPFPWAGGTCHQTHTMIDTWLGREAGPLGRALARAIDYLRPQPLIAADAGESGETDASSPFGTGLLEIIKDDFQELGPAPDIGDLWTITAQHPGFVRINEAGVGDMPGPVVELSQGQGACTNCPLFQLLATRENGTTAEAVGIYEVTWTSLQAGSNLKEAPFVILNAGNSNNEIARLSYTRVNSQNQPLIFTVYGNGNSVQTFNVGQWAQNAKQDFKVTVRLNTLDPATSRTVSLSIDGVPFDFDPSPTAQAFNVAAPRATQLKQIGYVLTKIDAGTIVSDNWRVIRLADITPP